MRKIASAVLMLLLAMSCVAFAQQDQDTNKQEVKAEKKHAKAESKEQKKEAKAEQKEAKAADKGKAMRLTGWVRSEGDKTVFVNDKDKQSWNVSNPDLLKGHEGHHVHLKAVLNEADHSMNVEKVSMMRQAKQSGELKHKKGQ